MARTLKPLSAAKKRKALDELYQNILTLYCQVHPHANTMPSGKDPYSFQIVDDSEVGEIIRSKDGFMEAYIDETPCIGRMGVNAVIVTVYPDDAVDKEFGGSLSAAARFFLCQQFQMHMECASLDKPTPQSHAA